MDKMESTDDKQKEQERSLPTQTCLCKDVKHGSSTETCEDCSTELPDSSLEASNSAAASKETCNENANELQKSRSMELKKPELQGSDDGSETREKGPACSSDHGSFLNDLSSNLGNKSKHPDLLSKQCAKTGSSAEEMDSKICVGDSFNSPLRLQAESDISRPEITIRNAVHDLECYSERQLVKLNNPMLCEQNASHGKLLDLKFNREKGVIPLFEISKFRRWKFWVKQTKPQSQKFIKGKITYSVAQTITKTLSTFFQLYYIGKPKTRRFYTQLDYCHPTEYCSFKDPLNLGLNQALNNLILESEYRVYFAGQIPFLNTPNERYTPEIYSPEPDEAQMDSEAQPVENYEQAQNYFLLPFSFGGAVYYHAHPDTQNNSPATHYAEGSVQMHQVDGNSSMQVPNQDGFWAQPQDFYTNNFVFPSIHYTQLQPTLFYPAQLQSHPYVVPPDGFPSLVPALPTSYPYRFPSVVPAQPTWNPLSNTFPSVVPAWPTSNPSSNLSPYYQPPFQVYHSNLPSPSPHNSVILVPVNLPIQPAPYSQIHVTHHDLNSFQQFPNTVPYASVQYLPLLQHDHVLFIPVLFPYFP